MYSSQLHTPLLAVLQQQRHNVPCSCTCSCHEGRGAAVVSMAAAAAAQAGKVLHYCCSIVPGGQQ
jgi:hypothetical protein